MHGKLNIYLISIYHHTNTVKLFITIKALRAHFLYVNL